MTKSELTKLVKQYMLEFQVPYVLTYYSNNAGSKILLIPTGSLYDLCDISLSHTRCLGFSKTETFTKKEMEHLYYWITN